MTSDPLIIKVGSREVNLGAAGPLRWKDIKALRSIGVDEEKLNAGDPENAERFIRFVLERALGGPVDQAEIDELELVDVQRIVRHFTAEVGQLDRPT